MQNKLIINDIIIQFLSFFFILHHYNDPKNAKNAKNLKNAKNNKLPSLRTNSKIYHAFVV